MTTVLVVEDDDSLMELLGDVFTDAGYRVVTARNGREALALVAVTALDVIISDIGLPEMDGYTLLRQVREMTQAVKVVLTSGAALRTDVLPQPDAFVLKPYKLARLLAVVAHCCLP